MTLTWLLLIALWTDGELHTSHYEFADESLCRSAQQRFVIEDPNTQIIEIWCYPIRDVTVGEK